MPLFQSTSKQEKQKERVEFLIQKILNSKISIGIVNHPLYMPCMKLIMNSAEYKRQDSIKPDWPGNTVNGQMEIAEDEMLRSIVKELQTMPDAEQKLQNLLYVRGIGFNFVRDLRTNYGVDVNLLAIQKLSKIQEGWTGNPLLPEDVIGESLDEEWK
ncbi:MAG: hypothetical protein AB2L18_07445 [Anaerolineaceae bacterium]